MVFLGIKSVIFKTIERAEANKNKLVNTVIVLK
jgi:hypothetical protein